METKTQMPKPTTKRRSEQGHLASVRLSIVVVVLISVLPTKSTCAKLETPIKLLINEDELLMQPQTREQLQTVSRQSPVQPPASSLSADDGDETPHFAHYRSELKRLSYETIHRILRDENEPIYRREDAELRYYQKRAYQPRHELVKRAVTNNLNWPEIMRNLSGQQMTVFNASVTYNDSNLQQVTTLDLSDNQLTVIDVAQLKRLRRLDLSGNALNTSIELSTLEALETLDLSCNQLNHIERAFFPQRIHSLRQLNLAHNQLGSISRETFYNLINLDTLLLSNNNISDIDYETFLALPNLQYLDLSQNQLRGESIRALQGIPDLMRLSIAYNPHVGASMQEFVASWSLKELDASGTGLCQIPAALAQSVRTLKLTDNWLKHINCGDLDSYPLLQYLDLSYSRIEDIEDDALGRLEILETLFLDHNLLRRVPLSLPTTLEHLFLQNNQIMDIQVQAFQGLNNLKTLDLSGNKLLYLPPLALPKLLTLNLQAAELKAVSQAIVHTMPQLRDLLLEYNPIRCSDLLGIAEWASPCRAATDDDEARMTKPQKVDLKPKYVQVHNFYEEFKNSKCKKKRSTPPEGTSADAMAAHPPICSMLSEQKTVERPNKQKTTALPDIIAQTTTTRDTEPKSSTKIQLETDISTNNSLAISSKLSITQNFNNENNTSTLQTTKMLTKIETEPAKATTPTTATELTTSLEKHHPSQQQLHIAGIPDSMSAASETTAVPEKTATTMPERHANLAQKTTATTKLETTQTATSAPAPAPALTVIPATITPATATLATINSEAKQNAATKSDTQNESPQLVPTTISPATTDGPIGKILGTAATPTTTSTIPTTTSNAEYSTMTELKSAQMPNGVPQTVLTAIKSAKVMSKTLSLLRAIQQTVTATATATTEELSAEVVQTKTAIDIERITNNNANVKPSDTSGQPNMIKTTEPTITTTKTTDTTTAFGKVTYLLQHSLSSPTKPQTIPPHKHEPLQLHIKDRHLIGTPLLMHKGENVLVDAEQLLLPGTATVASSATYHSVSNNMAHKKTSNDGKGYVAAVTSNLAKSQTQPSLQHDADTDKQHQQQQQLQKQHYDNNKEEIINTQTNAHYKDKKMAANQPPTEQAPDHSKLHTKKKPSSLSIKKMTYSTKHAATTNPVGGSTTMQHGVLLGSSSIQHSQQRHNTVNTPNDLVASHELNTFAEFDANANTLDTTEGETISEQLLDHRQPSTEHNHPGLLLLASFGLMVVLLLGLMHVYRSDMPWRRHMHARPHHLRHFNEDDAHSFLHYQASGGDNGFEGQNRMQKWHHSTRREAPYSSPLHNLHVRELQRGATGMVETHDKSQRCQQFYSASLSTSSTCSGGSSRSSASGSRTPTMASNNFDETNTCYIELSAHANATHATDLLPMELLSNLSSTLNADELALQVGNLAAARSSEQSATNSSQSQNSALKSMMSHKLAPGTRKFGIW